MCLDPTIATLCVDRPPPLYVCTDCVDLLNPDHVRYLVDVIQPIETVSLTCENKVCIHYRMRRVFKSSYIRWLGRNLLKPSPPSGMHSNALGLFIALKG